MKKIIAIDMDDTIAKLVHDWIQTVNEYEGENVLMEDITCWNIDKYFKCKSKVYSYLNYDLFRNLPVIEESQRVIKELMNHYEVFIVTSATSYPDTLKAKVDWLEEHFSFISPNNIVLCGSKRIIKADIMIDDGVHNLETFDGMKILFDAPHNRDNKDERFSRVANWNQIEKLLIKEGN